MTDESNPDGGRAKRSNDEGAKPPRDYEVGYGKPPKATQFAKGNRRGGRTKGALSLKTDLLRELAERVVITEDGKKRSLTKQQILVKAQVQKGMKGHVGAGAYVTGLILKIIGPDGETKHEVAIPEADYGIIEAFIRRRTEESAS